MNRTYDNSATTMPRIADHPAVDGFAGSASDEPTVKPQNAAAETGTIPNSQRASQPPVDIQFETPARKKKKKKTGRHAAPANQPAANNLGSRPGTVRVSFSKVSVISIVLDINSFAFQGAPSKPLFKN